MHLNWRAAERIVNLSAPFIYNGGSQQAFNRFQSAVDPVFKQIIRERAREGKSAPSNNQIKMAYLETLTFSAYQKQIFNIFDQYPSYSEQEYDRIWKPGFAMSIICGAILVYVDYPLLAPVLPALLWLMRKADLVQRGIKSEFQRRKEFFEKIADEIVEKINAAFNQPVYADFDFEAEPPHSKAEPPSSATFERMTREKALSYLKITVQNPSSEEIQRAWKGLVREHYPKVNQGDKEAENLMKDINQAYTFLSKK